MRAKIHNAIDIPPEFPKPPEVAPKRPPPVVFVFDPKPVLVAPAPKAEDLRHSSELWSCDVLVDKAKASEPGE